MERPTRVNLEELAKRYWKQFLLAFDRDKFKAILSPDRDWEHLFILFFVTTLLFAAVGGYLYFEIDSSGAASKQPPALSKGTAREKIMNTAASITKAENTFNDLVSKKPDVADPSR